MLNALGTRPDLCKSGKFQEKKRIYTKLQMNVAGILYLILTLKLCDKSEYIALHLTPTEACSLRKIVKGPNTNLTNI